MPNTKYAVVSFVNDNAASEEEIASEIPIEWLSADHKKCWWPKVKNVNIFISKSILPEVDDPKWELHDVECHGFYETLETARKRAENSYSSSDESMKNYSRTLRKKVVRTASPIAESDTDDDIMNIQIPQFPTVRSLESDVLQSLSQCSTSKAKQIKNYTSQPQTGRSNALSESRIGRNCAITSSTSKDDRNYSIIPSNRTSQLSKLQTKKNSTHNLSGVKNILNNSTPRINRTAQNESAAGISLNDILLDEDLPIILNRDAELHTKIVEKMEDNFNKAFIALASLSVDIAVLGERLNKIEELMTKANPRADTEAFTEISVMFPFKTKEDILIFEGNLATDPELMDKLVKYLSQIGGNSAKENIVRIMRKVFTNNVARQSSWLGLRNNFKISCLKTTLGIKIAVMTRFKMTDKEFEEIASEWLRQANQRCTREQKRVQNNL